MKYMLVVKAKDDTLTHAIVEENTFMGAVLIGKQYVFDKNDGNEGGYSLLAVIGEHPLISLGVK